jgi:hypothetical protein
MPVAMPDARFGHAIQSPAAGCMRGRQVAITAMTWPSLIPSFCGSGVPE